MALFNHTTRELTAKIVYYGPALGGKTTNLRTLHEKLDHAARGKLLSLSTAQDRTIYFDLLPVELGNIKGYSIRFQLCTVPGQVLFNETRKIVLRGVDGIVFVVDSQPTMLSHDLESFQNLRENLRQENIPLESLPVVIQYNKRDLPASLPIAVLQESLGCAAFPFVEASATEGTGIVETFRLVSKLTFVDLLRRLQKGEPGMNETAAAAFVAATEAEPALAPEASEIVFARAEPSLPAFQDAASVLTEPELTLDDPGPELEDEPPPDSSLATSGFPFKADHATTRAIQAPPALPPLLPPEEPFAPFPEAAATEPAEPREPAEPPPPAPPPAPPADAGREKAETRFDARLSALEEEISALRIALAESRRREDSLQARTDELKRRWDLLRHLVSEDGPSVG